MVDRPGWIFFKWMSLEALGFTMFGLSWWRHILSFFFWNGLYILPLYNTVANFNEHQLNGNRLILLVLGRFFEHIMYRNSIWPRTLHVIVVFFTVPFHLFWNEDLPITKKLCLACTLYIYNEKPLYILKMYG